jgi:hypothetical protein
MNTALTTPDVLTVLKTAIEKDFVQPPARSAEETAVKLLEKKGMLFAVHFAQFSRYYPTNKGKDYYKEATNDRAVWK